MPAKLCVYTCITGNYDNLHEITNPEKSVDYLCFTNNKSLKSKTWKIIHIEDKTLTDHLLSRKIKMLGHPIINENYDVSVWMDGSVVWDQPVSEFVKTYLKDNPFAAFKHHARSSIHEEALACLTFRKDNKDSLLKTLRFLEKANFPDDIGLYEMTVFIKRHNNPCVIQAMNAWFDAISQYSKRDQLSFMYAAWQAHLQITTIKLNIWNNQWFHNTKHSKNPLPDYALVNYCDYYSLDNLESVHSYNFKQQDNAYSISATIPQDTKIISINPFNTIGLFYNNPIIHPQPENISIHGSLKINNGNLSCTEFNLIKINGNFRKGQKLVFSMTIQPSSNLPINGILDTFWRQNNQLSSQNAVLIQEVKTLKNEKNKLQQDLTSILDSKGWRTLEKLRKAKTIFKSPNK